MDKPNTKQHPKAKSLLFEYLPFKADIDDLIAFKYSFGYGDLLLVHPGTLYRVESVLHYDNVLYCMKLTILSRCTAQNPAKCFCIEGAVWVSHHVYSRAQPMIIDLSSV